MFWQSYESTPEIPIYQCILQNQGCHKDDDCHIGGAGTVTYCHGPTCFEYRDLPFGPKAKYIVVRTQGSQHYYEGINKSCHYKSPFRAYCILNYYRQEIIWHGEGNVNLALQRQRAQYRSERPQVEQL